MEINSPHVYYFLKIPLPWCFFFFVVNFVIHWNETAMGLTCVPHPDPPSHLPLHPLPLGFPSAPGPSACLMHPTWAGDLFHALVFLSYYELAFIQPQVSYFLSHEYKCLLSLTPNIPSKAICFTCSKRHLLLFSC